jgi:hypothetical protein
VRLSTVLLVSAGIVIGPSQLFAQSTPPGFMEEFEGQ